MCYGVLQRVIESVIQVGAIEIGVNGHMAYAVQHVLSIHPQREFREL